MFLSHGHILEVEIFWESESMPTKDFWWKICWTFYANVEILEKWQLLVKLAYFSRVHF